MITRIDHKRWEIRAHDRWTIEDELSIAETAAQHEAQILGYGVEVTQLDYNTFALTITQGVPYGQTWTKLLKGTQPDHHSSTAATA